MTSTQPSTKSTQFKLPLEVATFDWRVTRVQFMLGFLITFITFALVAQSYFTTPFLPEEYLAVGRLLSDGSAEVNPSIGLNADPFLYIQLLLFSHHGWWYRTIGFVITGLSALTIGLITMELTSHYGNRTGASAAIFASLLFMTMPLHNPLTFPATLFPVLLSNLFALVAVFVDLRFRLVRETGYFFVALLCAVVAGALDPRGIVIATIGLVLSRLVLNLNENRSPGGPLHSYVGTSIYFLAMILFLAPHVIITQSEPTSINSAIEFVSIVFGGSEEGRFIQRVLPILFVTVFGVATLRLLLGALWLRPIVFTFAWFLSALAAWCLLGLGLDKGGFNIDHSATQGLYLAPALSMLLALLAIPAVDTLSKRARTGLTILGCAVASAIVVGWGSMVAEDVDNNYLRARELGLFKMEMTKRMEKTGGKLVVINPPLSIGLNEQKLTARSRDDDEHTLHAMLCSPLNGQSMLVDSKRGSPNAFVRLSKRDRDAVDPAARAITDFYVWTGENGRLMPIYYAGAGSIHLTADGSFKTEPHRTARVNKDEWAQVESGQPFVERSANGLRLNAGKDTDLLVWLPLHVTLDPTKAATISVDVAGNSSTMNPEVSPLSVIFKGRNSDEVGEFELNAKPRSNTLTASTKGVADWNKHSGITALGVKLKAGSPSITITAIDASRINRVDTTQGTKSNEQ